jgi:hypothetical protein
MQPHTYSYRANKKRGEDMGEKYTPERLAAMRSIGHLKGGRTRHTSAGSILADVKETQTEDDFVRETTDVHGSVITEHRDGRMDADVHPEPLVVDLHQ